MLKDKNMKMLATGVGAAGVLSGVKVILKKDLLAGLADFKGLGANEPTVFRDPVQLQVERYNPDLPELNAVYMPYPNPMDVEEENERERGIEGPRERKSDNVFMEIM